MTAKIVTHVDRGALARRISHLAEKAGSGRELARRAGLKSSKHVSSIIQRCEADPHTGIELGTLEAIAAGAEVPLSDLLGVSAAGYRVDALPGWASAEEEGRRRYPKLRAEAWEAARKVTVPRVVEVDLAFAAGLARLLDDAQPAGPLSS